MMMLPRGASSRALTRRARPLAAAGLVWTTAALGGCVGDDSGAARQGSGTTTSEGQGGRATSGGGAGSGRAAPGTGGNLIVPTTPATTLDDADTGQAVACSSGDGCTCPPFNLAVLGKPGKWGANPDGDPDLALQDWLTSSSAGTARADNFTTRQPLTPEFLANYNVVILASLSEDSSMGPFWTFTDDEVAAFQAWVENGGGVISLIGYSSGDEARPNNQLLAFSGISYGDGVWGTCVDWSVCNCTHSMTVSDWIRSDPVIANLSTDVNLVGFENGRVISSPADAHVAATIDGKSILVGKLVGEGRVLAFGDEWITYTSQWTGAGNPSASDSSCKGKLPQDQYQMAQFWYNMIRWTQPTASCFKIVDDDTPVTIW